LFVCASNISGTTERICAKFTVKTCLVPRSDKFECQGPRSKLPGTKSTLSTPVTSRMVYACCKQRAATVDGTISSLLGVISGACVRCMFDKTSLTLVSCFLLLSVICSNLWHGRLLL